MIAKHSVPHYIGTNFSIIDTFLCYSYAKKIYQLASNLFLERIILRNIELERILFRRTIATVSFLVAAQQISYKDP